MYDPVTGRFNTKYTKSEIYTSWSNYLYAVNNPVRYIDINGEGPGDRVKAARNQVSAGNTYRQEGGILRTASTTEALRHMDCSEFVSRVMGADQITSGVESRNTKALVSYLGNETDFNRSDSPHAGDIALWYNPRTGKGHTGIVTAVDRKHPNRFRLAHATYGKRPSQENSAFTTEEVYSGGHYDLVGYFSPVNETPDGKLDGNNSSQGADVNEPDTPGNGSGNADNSNSWDRFNQHSWFKKLSPESKTLIIDAFDKRRKADSQAPKLN